MESSKYNDLSYLIISNEQSFIVPRTFRLYEELEKAEHAQLSDQSVSYGLDKGKLYLSNQLFNT